MGEHACSNAVSTVKRPYQRPLLSRLMFRRLLLPTLLHDPCMCRGRIRHSQHNLEWHSAWRCFSLSRYKTLFLCVACVNVYLWQLFLIGKLILVVYLFGQHATPFRYYCLCAVAVVIFM